MAADASIYGMLRPVAAPDPMEQVGKAMTIQGLMGQQELQALQTQQARQGLADDQALRGAYQESGGDSERLKAALYRTGNPKAIQAFEKSQQDKLKADADLQKTDRENFVALTAQRFKERQTVQTPEQYAAHRDEAIRSAGMFKTPELRKVALSSAMSMPEKYDPQWVARSIVDGKELFTPKMVEQTDGQTKRMVDTNPFTNPAILSQAPTQMQTTPGERLTDDRTRSEGAANRGVTMRGQNLTDARSKETLAQGGRTYDAERGIVVNTRENTAVPVTQAGAPIGPKDKELNDAQAKALLFSSRMAEAEKVITDLAKVGKDVSTPGSRTGFGVGATVNAFNTTQGQQLDQAKRNFINAVLRRESGAVIAESEFDNAERQYFPQVGEDATVRAQKAANRKTALDGIMAEVPKAKRPAAGPVPTDKGVPDSAPSQAAIDAELRRRGVIR